MLEVYFLTNKDIRLYAAGKGVRLWQIAKEMGIRDSSLSRKLRSELPDDEKQKIIEIVARISMEG